MKCRSVACIWSAAPPSHRVTATAVLNYPLTLYTGGSDGSILWWNLSHSNPEVKPIAMFCGHAAPIADLGICHPVVVSENGKAMDNRSDGALNSTSDYGALLSACTDGVLCVWSRRSGHCRRRRKLPPWVGSPLIVCTLPTKTRYVCVGCSFIDAVHSSEHDTADLIEGGEVLLDKESLNPKSSKFTVVIVDTYTLTIVQTVFHGNSSIGPLKFMSVVPLAEDMEKHSVLMTDSSGKLQLVPISNDSHPDGSVAGSDKSFSHTDIAIFGDEVTEGGKIVSVITCQTIVALVLNFKCIFRLVCSGDPIGEIFFVDNFNSLEGDSTQSQVIGGIFLESGDAKTSTKENSELFSKNFAVWDNKGSAIIYNISYVNDLFKYERLCGIPAASHDHGAKSLFQFIQLKLHLLRVESVCYDVEEPIKWRPRVTVWSVHHGSDDNGKIQPLYRMVGEDSYLTDWISCYKSCQRSLVSSDSNMSSPCEIGAVDKAFGFAQKGRVVSSSMVISENFYTPYAVVYGFFDGEIEVVGFDLLHRYDSPAGSPRYEMDSLVSKQLFSGHTGAVLCLAAHRMVGSGNLWSFTQVLISGSMDCTVRIWNLDTGDLITVMHQHVAPVRQIILPPASTSRPWSDCFLSVGDDSCVALSSLETLRVERMFPGHPSNPAKVVWDGVRSYIASLCHYNSKASDAIDVLYIWDVKTGARERVLRGTASHSMFDHFCKGISMNSISGSVLNGNTSVSSLLLQVDDDFSSSHSQVNNYQRGGGTSNAAKLKSSQEHISKGNFGREFPITPSAHKGKRYPIRCSCPFPGIATLNFDLASLTFPFQKHGLIAKSKDNHSVKEQGSETPNSHDMMVDNDSSIQSISNDSLDGLEQIRALEEYLIRFSLSFLHLWEIDSDLDRLLITEMKLRRPDNFIVGAGLQGDKGSITLTFPGSSAILELWKSSSEFCAMRSLTMVSLAQCMIGLSPSSSAASSALAAFYTRNFADRFPDLKPPLLQLLVTFWQDDSHHVRMAARSLFHCAASRAIPAPLCSQQASEHEKRMRSLSGLGDDENKVSNIDGQLVNVFHSSSSEETKEIFHTEEAELLAWLQSFEMQDWISCVGGTSQDAMASHIIVAAALSIWYPSLVKPSLAALVVHQLMKLVMAMNEKYSCTAVELLAEGMESTWKACISSEIPRLLTDIFFQIECVTGPSTNSAVGHPSLPASIREALIATLLPSLAMADIHGFLSVIESQIWSTASDSPVHVVSLKTLIRVVRGSPRNIIQCLDKVVNFILQTMDPGNSVMRRTCRQGSMAALKEVVRVFPMVALNEASTKLAVGDAVAEINKASIRVYDMQSMTKIKVLDASGPPGLPSLLAGTSERMVTTAISALSFSPDGEGLIAYSEQGLVIRWWSLGSVWWEKLSRNLVPVQCTKLIFVPPWEGFSPNSSRSSVMANIMEYERETNRQENDRDMNHADYLKQLIHNLELSYRLEWTGDRKLLLTRHGHEVAAFQL